MFTGLIQRVGTLRSMQPRGNGGRLTIAHVPWDEPWVHGESVAVQGACLTVSAMGESVFSCDVLEETLIRTNLRDTPAGARLNLERALRAGDRFGGHMVQGHVDGQGEVIAVRRSGNDYVLRMACDRLLLTEMVEKGSIAVDGVSLTIAVLHDDGFEVHLIPVTWDETSLAERKAGDRVNLETDIVGKYIRRRLEAVREGVTMEMLAKNGYV